jgi:hypothetical protein
VLGAYRRDGPDLITAGQVLTDAGSTALIYGGSALSSTIDLGTDKLAGSGLGLILYGREVGEGAGFYVATGNQPR